MPSSPARYDPFSSDPSSQYPALRAAACPVHRYVGDDNQFFVVARYEDVRAVLADASLFSMRFGQMHTYVPGQGLTVDPPVHTVLRRLLNPLFTPKRMQLLEPRIQRIADELLDAVDFAVEGDFYRDFASPFPVHVAAEFLGVDPARKADLRCWVYDFTAGLNAGDQQLETGAREAVYGYFAELMAARRAALARGEPVADDLITLLVTGEHPDGRPFTDDELLPTTILLLAGGVDTSGFLLTNCLYRLLSERERLWEQVCARPELIPVAVEESLRFDSPVFGTFRTNEQPVRLHGVVIPRDSKIQMLFASANHDAAMFEDPDTFRLDRDLEALRRDHLAFGGGIHGCIGKAVARLSARIALQTLARRFPNIEIAGPPQRYSSVPGAIAVNNGFVSLPVRWTGA